MRLSNKQFNKILKKQCDMVGTDWKKFFGPYLDGRDMPQEWFRKYAWTEEDENKFLDWLMNYLHKLNPGVSLNYIEQHARAHIFNYGWVTKTKLEKFAKGGYKRDKKFKRRSRKEVNT